jgi:tetracycline repressor-like protein
MGRYISQPARPNRPGNPPCLSELLVEPRRMEARRLLQQAMKNGEIRSDLNPDTILDIFYGPLYLRLLVRNTLLTESFVDLVFDIVLSGLGK